MTDPAKTLALLGGRLDDVRHERAWRAVARAIAEPAVAPRRRWWLVPASAAMLGAAIATAAMLAAGPSPAQVVPTPPVRVPVAVPIPTPVPVPIAVPTVAPAPAAPPPPQPRSPSAGELYRKAEAALAAHDEAAARATLDQLVRLYPGDRRVDAARYDLALIARRGGDLVRARELLDELIAHGRDAGMRAAAEQLRRRL